MHGGLEMPPLPLVPFGSILAAGLSLSAAPHVSAADTLSIASGLNPDILYSLRAPERLYFPEKTKKIPLPLAYLKKKQYLCSRKSLEKIRITAKKSFEKIH